jgi:hypothetical protein
MAMLELFLPLAMNAHPSQVPDFSGHYRLLLMVGQFGELMSHGQVTNPGSTVAKPCRPWQALLTPIPVPVLLLACFNSARPRTDTGRDYRGMPPASGWFQVCEVGADD